MRMFARWALRGLGAVLVLGLVIHLPMVRNYLAVHGYHGRGVCPLGYSTSAPRIAHRTPVPDAPPALGFHLGTTTGDDVMAWSAQRKLGCRSTHGGTTIECRSVPAYDLPAAIGALDVGTVWFQLDDKNAVSSIRTVRDSDRAEPIAWAFDDVERALAAATGAPTTRDGSASPGELARGALAQAMVEHRTAGYRAVVRATNIGHGYALTEDYTQL